MVRHLGTSKDAQYVPKKWAILLNENFLKNKETSEMSDVAFVFTEQNKPETGVREGGGSL